MGSSYTITTTDAQDTALNTVTNAWNASHALVPGFVPLTPTQYVQQRVDDLSGQYIAQQQAAAIAVMAVNLAKLSPSALTAMGITIAAAVPS